MVTSPLHVERAQVQSQMHHKLEQPLPQSIHHHVILSVQFSRTADQTTEQRVNATWRDQIKVRVTDGDRVTDKLLPFCLYNSPSNMILQGVKKALNKGTLGNRGSSL